MTSKTTDDALLCIGRIRVPTEVHHKYLYLSMFYQKFQCSVLRKFKQEGVMPTHKLSKTPKIVQVAVFELCTR